MRTVVLAGNPNCGKTTLFNRLTGSNQHVGNWAGVTVERREGVLRGPTEDVLLVDLPGIYSLTPYTLEERVARDCLLGGEADLVLNLLDGTSLERGLYLTLQLRELGCRMAVAVGMIDEVRAAGGAVDCAALSGTLGVPVVAIAARGGENLGALLDAVFKPPARQDTPPRYGAPLEGAAAEAACLLAELTDRRERLRYDAFCLLEREEDAELPPAAARRAADIRQGLERRCGQDGAVLVAQGRYRLIDGMVRRAVRPPPARAGGDLSDRIDRAALHRLLAFPLFFAVMAGMLGLCFGSVGAALKALMERAAARVSGWAGAVLPALGVSDAVTGLLVDGVIGGVGGVLTFLPQMALIFLCMTLLEECGYLARAAFLMDLPLRRLGLTGKSFIPMLMGLGCTTPAVMAARTLENDRDRRLTVLLTPYLPCSARLPICALFAGAFFPERQGLAAVLLYAAGIAALTGAGVLLRGGPFRGTRTPFLMEFPPYRLPSPRNVARNTGEKCGDFLRRAGTLIFLMSVGVWGMQHLTVSLRFTEAVGESLFAALGGALAPLFAPLGFGNREAAVALLAGLASKEAVVSTLGVACAAGGLPLSEALGLYFTPLSAASFLTFCALYTPCVSALASMRRELRSTSQMLLAALGQTLAAYIAALAVFQLGTLWGNLFG